MTTLITNSQPHTAKTGAQTTDEANTQSAPVAISHLRAASSRLADRAGAVHSPAAPAHPFTAKVA
jgi:hypothetical protein